MRKAACALALLVLPATSMAEMSYQYVEAGAEFGDVEILGQEYDATTLGAEASFAAHKNVALQVGVSTDELDLPAPLDASGHSYYFNALGHIPVHEKVDLLLGAGVGYVELEVSNGPVTSTDDDTAKALLAGARVQLADGIEGEARVNMVDAFGDTDESYDLLARVNFNQMFSGSVGYSWSDGYSGLQVAARFNY